MLYSQGGERNLFVERKVNAWNSHFEVNNHHLMVLRKFPNSLIFSFCIDLFYFKFKHLLQQITCFNLLKVIYYSQMLVLSLLFLVSKVSFSLRFHLAYFWCTLLGIVSGTFHQNQSYLQAIILANFFIKKNSLICFLVRFEICTGNYTMTWTRSLTLHT